MTPAETPSLSSETFSCAPSHSAYTISNGINDNGQVIRHCSTPSFGGGFWLNGGISHLLVWVSDFLARMADV
jgi:hypothetical protein